MTILKNALAKSFLFLSLVSGMIIFNALFGPHNLLIGISAMLQLVMLMKFNLTKRFGRRFAILFCTHMALGVAYYLTTLNIYVAALVNFSTFAFLGLVMTYEYTKLLLLPYGLQYLFMLRMPVEGHDLELRFLALASIPFMVMFVQWLFHRNRDDLPTLDDTEKKRWLKDPVIVNYALKVATLVTFTLFVTDYFELHEGIWMAFTVFSISEFYATSINFRALEQVKGTLIGVTILGIFLFFINNEVANHIILVVAAYFMLSTQEYRKITVYATIVAILSTSIADGPAHMIVSRVMYAVIGAALSIVAARIFPPPLEAPEGDPTKEEEKKNREKEGPEVEPELG